MASRKPNSRPAVRHPSHNHHLRAFKAQDINEIICSGCSLELTGQAFQCTKSDCDYFLHKSCFDLPREVKHKSHPEHPLTLLHSSPYGDSFECSGCGETGSGFTYNCSDCEYDLHVGCVVLPETVEREDHQHPLTLLYRNPCKDYEEDVRFVCSTCEGCVSDNLWVYYCKDCDYGTHVHSCAAYEDHEPKKEEGEGGESSSAASMMKSLMKAQDEMAALQLKARLKKDTNDFMLRLWN